ncbi:exosortase-associated protein EpsI, B-type [Methylophilus sp.]|uniref:exosortase-associated protein EpsI, B-type n=1 Tax=Methylophilus sp. TaxID=29541 RepID=UPI00257F5CC5|nr:exosortase-associated protein EpsI, B-type [Methylophilus sp.]
MNSFSIKSWACLVLMSVTAILSLYLQPSQKLADTQVKINLATMVPSSFNGWHEVEQLNGAIVNPEQKLLIDKLYSQTLSKVYQRGEHTIMLSIAYGENQSDATALHYPEVCYPAQGFRILDKKSFKLITKFKTIPSKQLVATNSHREEFITYWTTLGDKAVRSKSEAKLEQIKYGLKGFLPDGMLFRVSSIGTNSTNEFSSQQGFIDDLLASMPEATRLRFTGTR